jgi:hypothetical protein
MIRKVSRYIMGRYRLEYYYGKDEYKTSDEGWFVLDLEYDEMNLQQIFSKIEKLVIEYTKEYRSSIDKEKPWRYEYKFKSSFDCNELEFLSKRAYDVLSEHGEITVLENV